MPASPPSTTPSLLTAAPPVNSPSVSTSVAPLDALFNNPLFAGGVGLAGLGAAAAIARKSAMQGASMIKRRLLVNVEISRQDESYPWILAWLSLPRPPTGFLTRNLTRIHDFSVQTKLPEKDGAGYTRFLLQPGYGRHIVRHKNAFVMVSREKQRSARLDTGVPHETVTLTALHAQQNIFEDIFTEAHLLAKMEQEGKTEMWTAKGMDWTRFGDSRRKRPIESVILDEGVRERIVEDVKDFLEHRIWYMDRGIPYRRGYLLYGPPGSGKSSFIQALAGELDFGVAIINLSERGLTDDRLAHLLTNLPPRSIVLLEDADAAFSNRRQVDSDGYGGGNVTFSGLLNALDGVVAGEERICFLTTNHIDRLDEALIRPGRVDMTVRIGHATRHQAAGMWERFYGDVDVDGQGKERFLRKLEALELFGDELHTSTASIQGLFLFNKGNMEGAIQMAEGLIPRIYEPEPARGIKTPA